MTRPRVVPAPPPPPCQAWSLQAADLAAPIAAEMACWPEGPSAVALVASGELVRLRPGALLPAASLQTPCDRALAIGCALGTELRASSVIADASACWVLLGGPAPRTLTLLTTARPVALAGVRMRGCPLDPSDVEAVAGCPLTVPARTATDLLRFEESESATHQVGLLVGAGHVDLAEIADRLAGMPGHPHLRRARERLARLGHYRRRHLEVLPAIADTTTVRTRLAAAMRREHSSAAPSAFSSPGCFLAG